MMTIATGHPRLRRFEGLVPVPVLWVVQGQALARSEANDERRMGHHIPWVR